ncbi:MAG: hypothetical protein QXO69_00385 [archaeon]
MTVGVKKQPRREKSRLSKKMKFYTRVGEIPPSLRTKTLKEEVKGEEATAVYHKISPLRQTVEKHYEESRENALGTITFDNLVRRLKFQRTLHSAGLPVPKPIRITKRVGRNGESLIVWEEQRIDGPIVRFMKDTPENMKKIQSMFEKTKALIIKEAKKRGAEHNEFYPFGDITEANAIYDPHKNKIYIIDMLIWNPQKNGKKDKYASKPKKQELIDRF